MSGGDLFKTALWESCIGFGIVKSRRQQFGDTFALNEKRPALNFGTAPAKP
jgi:hypothetical protein